MVCGGGWGRGAESSLVVSRGRFIVASIEQGADAVTGRSRGALITRATPLPAVVREGSGFSFLAGRCRACAAAEPLGRQEPR